MNVKKLALGSAQFGMDYGINNSRGKIAREEVFSLLDFADGVGINALDTAAAYGESEAVLGEYPRIKRFEIISKLSRGVSAEESLMKLGIPSFYGYLLHDFSLYKNDPRLWDAMLNLRAEGKTRKVGFSLYYPEELELLFERKIDFGLLQVPYNVFDQRFKPYFVGLKTRQVEIHVRSVFLQGLVFKDPAALDGSFGSLREKLAALRSLAQAHDLSVAGLCLQFVLNDTEIDRVVVGVDGLQHLKGIVKEIEEMTMDEDILKEMASLIEPDQELVLPFNWKRPHVGAMP